MTKLTKKQQKINDARIDSAYRARCFGIQINLMDIPKVFKVGEAAIAEGADDATLADRVHAYVLTIAKEAA
jgi:hypothetical protein